MKFFFVTKNAHGAENTCKYTLNLVQIVFSRKKKNFDKNFKISTFLPFFTVKNHDLGGVDNFYVVAFLDNDTHISRWVARISNVLITSHTARTRMGCMLKLHHRPGTILALTQKKNTFWGA